MDVLLKCNGLHKVYRRRDTEVPVLNGVSLEVGKGEIVSIMGPSGSGKTTLLHLLSALDRPSAGEVYFRGQPLYGRGDAELAALRRREFGFVFQFFNLLPTLTALENAALPLLLDGRSLASTEARGRELLEAVGLASRWAHYPHQLSGGEMQRVAVARALAMEPAMIFADEPTGNLDRERGTEVLNLLIGQTRAQGRTLLMVTHDAKVADAADRIVKMQDGRVEADPEQVLPD